MNTLLFLILTLLASTEEAKFVPMKGVVEKYSPDALHINTGDNPHIFMDIVSIGISDPKKYAGKKLHLIVVHDLRSTWNKPKANFKCLIERKELDRILEDDYAQSSVYYLRNVEFLPKY